MTMITSDHSASQASSAWRYRLDRTIDMLAMMVVGTCLHNPSTADADADDPTSTRCIDFARRAGAGRLIMINPWAARATKPPELWLVGDPVGPENDTHITEAASEISASGGFMIVGWGVIAPPARLRASAFKRLLQVEALILSAGCPIRALGVNGNGSPKHPLYIRATASPVAWPDGWTALKQRDAA